MTTWAAGDLLNSTNLNAKNPAWSKTVNASTYSGATSAAKITAAIADAVTKSFQYVFIPATMIPFDATQTTFNTAVRLVREGQASWEEYDVVAYGAKGDGIQDDYTALQTAITHSLAAPGRAVRLPALGASNTRYTITQGLVASGNVVLLGTATASAAGLTSPQIFGSVNAPLLTVNGHFTASGMRIEGLTFQQTNTGTSAACISVNTVGAPAVITKCYFLSSHHGVLFTDGTFVVSVTDCTFEGGLQSGGIGLFTVGHAMFRALNFSDWDTAIQQGSGGGGTTYTGIRIEVCRTGFLLAQELNGSAGAITSISIEGVSFEANDTCIDAINISNSRLGELRVAGSANSPSTTAVYGIKVKSAVNTRIENVGITTLGGLSWTQAGFYVDPAGTRKFFTIANVQSINGNNTASWSIPAQQGLELTNCNTDNVAVAFSGNLGVSPITIDTGQVTLGAGQFYNIAPTSLSTISSLSNGAIGRPLYLRATNGNVGIQNGVSIFLKGGADQSLATNETITLVQFASGRWDEI